MAIKVLAIICPVVLFLVKYALPTLAEEALTKRRRSRVQLLIELIHFPVDLLFVVIGYTIPKIIETYTQFTALKDTMEKTAEFTKELVHQYENICWEILVYSGESILTVVLVSFMVFITKIAENNYYQKRKRWILQTLGCYLIAGILIWVSIFRA